MGNSHRSSSSLRKVYGVQKGSSMKNPSGVHTTIVKHKNEEDYLGPVGKEAVLQEKQPPQKQKSIVQKEDRPKLLCQYCNNTIVDSQFSTHLTTCSANPDNIAIQCENCKKAFSLTAYQQHLIRCEEESKLVTLVCEMCNKGIIVGEYLGHVEDCQRNPQNHVSPCLFCRQLFTKEAHKAHKNQCKSNPDNVKTKCKFCQKTMRKIVYHKHIKECEETYKRKMEENECSICLIEIKKTDKTTYLACFHKFHEECINDWSKKQKICPICRTDFPQQ